MGREDAADTWVCYWTSNNTQVRIVVGSGRSEAAALEDGRAGCRHEGLPIGREEILDRDGYALECGSLSVESIEEEINHA